ncbi:MAG TPA: DUF5602 domain-containing protein [Gemmatimonadaceae bacterium]|nr:DUF5602 domain-containing protein [Gemmatimonadaceae bacterium]
MRRITGTHGRARALTLALLASSALAACRGASGDAPSASHTTYGRAVRVGNGTARTYVTIAKGKSEVGVALSEGALAGLPDEHARGGVHAHGHTTFESVLELPAGNPTPFRHVLMNWNPRGHEPPRIYDTPHFDFHFYVIENAERLAIDPADPEFQRKAERKPDARWIPARYVMPAPLAFARMGVHWVDTTSAELTGQPFTRTMIYGSWDGKVIFAEPMITKAYLETKPQFSATLPAPPRGRVDGFYPEGYSVRWDAERGEYRVALTGVGTATRRTTP